MDWAAVPDSTVAPWYGARHGKAEIPGFFRAINESTQVTEFTPLALTSDDNNVMAVIRYGITARATGRSGVMLIHHWFRFRGDLIDFVRTSEDSALVASLLAP